MTDNKPANWIEINKEALAHNYQEIRCCLAAKVKLMAVVKADAYGHGLSMASSVFAEEGSDYLGVTTIEEGIEIRNVGISTPILLFSPILPDQVETALRLKLDLTVCHAEQSDIISSTAVSLNTIANVHVKVDTGMGRLGIHPDECAILCARLMRLPNVNIAGTYTHFSDAAAKDPRRTQAQMRLFAVAVTRLRDAGMYTGLVHAANSAGLLNFPEAHFDMVRPGTLLYGQYPSRYVKHTLDLRDSWRLKTRIVSLQRISAGKRIGYGSEYTTRRETVAAVIPVGYSDGFTLIPESLAARRSSPVKAVATLFLNRNISPFVYINGERAPVIGRVSMQMCSVDVTDIKGVKTGDEVVVPARRTSVSSRILRTFV